ncbi:MAG: TonB-dependent receptor [Candidatus Aminicenantes bacterium]|nr:TonB-dependent receptor [Candidatus Aminicenantes bacterium]
MKHKLLMLFVAAVVVFCGALYGQEQKGEVIGTVVLEDGSAIPGVAVECEGTGLVGKKATITTDNGSFRFMALPSGAYDFTFILEGFKTVKRTGIQVSIGRTYKLDVVMETGAIRQEIVVTGKSPVIDVRKSASTVNISKAVFDKLPKGRDFMTIVTQTAGLNFESEFQDGTERANGDYSAGVSFDGASSAENTFYVDGVDTTTLFKGKAGASVNFDFIEEVQVKSSGYAAEYGGSMGGVISVITRSGGNEYHGQLAAYYDGSVLSGANRKSLRINPFDADVAEYVVYPKDKMSTIEPGFGLGGYIIKDKLWFFGSFMPKFKTTERNGNDWPVPNPATQNPISTIFAGETHFSGSNIFTRKDTTYAGSLKLTGQIANNLRVSVSGTVDYEKWKGELPAVDGSGNVDKDYKKFGYTVPRFTVGGNIDYTLGNNLMINASAGYFKADNKQLVGPTEPRYYFLRSNSAVAGVDPANIRARGWNNYSDADGYQSRKQIETKLTGTFDMTYYANMGGEHVFKAGVQMVRVGVDKDSAYPYNYFRFYWGDNYEHSDANTRHTTLGYVEVRNPFGVVATVNSTRWAVYLQDSWTISEKFTLNLGARVEKEDIPAFAPGYAPPVSFDFFDKFAPRVGFAYDVFGDSSLKVFGSFGIYYDVMKLEAAEGSYGGFKWISHYYDIVNADWYNTYKETTHPQTGGLYGGQYYESRNWRVVSFDTTQPDMKPYQKNEFTFGVQKTLTEDWTVSGRFLYNYIVNAIEDIGVLIGGSENYYNGNPGSQWIQDRYDEAQAAGTMPNGIKATKAVRKYTSVTLNLDRKFKNNWLGGLSYTWSRLYGNFAGLASSDEHGRKSPSVERYFDGWFLTYNQDGKDYLGLLATDRPHQFKVYGAYTFDFGLTFGLNAFAMSGTPLQTEVYLNDMQGFYPLGRGNLGRNDFLWQIDIYAEYNLKLSDKYTLNFNVNVSNITNNDIAQRTDTLYNDAKINLPEQTLLDGWDYITEVAAKGAHLSPSYKWQYRFMDSIAARIGVKFLF